MTKLEMIKAVVDETKRWFKEDYLAPMDKEGLSRSLTEAAAVQSIIQNFENYIYEQARWSKSEEEIEFDYFFNELTSQDFYDFFFEYEKTPLDIVDYWLFCCNEPEYYSVFSICNNDDQRNDILLIMSYVLKDIKAKEVK